MEEAVREKKKASPKLILLLVGVIAAVAAVVVFVLPMVSPGQSQQQVVLTASTLEKIIDRSELSTFTAVYNGVAKASNEKDPEKTDYYVSYNATVTAGIDIKEIDIDIDDEAFMITITLPEPRINDITVDITSLDYIFVNKKADTPEVVGNAYKLCEQDVKEESSKQEAILELSAQNAQNFVRALTEPIVNQFYPEYSLIVE